MTAVPAWGGAPEVQKPCRRHLHSVPTGDDVMPPSTHASTRMRLTRRGRLAITLSVLCALLLGGFAVARAMAAPVEDVPAPTVTVQPGDSLSQVAHEAMPGLPVREAIARIQVENRMNSLQVQAGQVLRIPR